MDVRVEPQSWMPKNWRFWTVVLEKTLESPLDGKEIKPVHSKGDQSWMFIGRADTEAPIFWTPDVKNWLIGKDADAGKDWRQEKGTTEDEMIGWHLRLDAHEFEQALGVGDGRGSLACCSPWGCKELDTIEWLNNFKTFGDLTYWSAFVRCKAEITFFFFAMGHAESWFPDQGWNLCPLHWKLRVLPTGPTREVPWPLLIWNFRELRVDTLG